MALIFTQLASDNFTRANEEPLNPANWTISPELGLDLAVLNDVCVVGSDATGSEIYTGIVSPADQYCAATIHAFDNINAPGLNGAVLLRLRIDPTGMIFWSISLQGNGDGTTGLVAINEPDETVFATATLGSVQPGDILLAAIVGNLLVVTYNGVQVVSLDTSADPIASGKTALRIAANSGQSLTSVSLFVTGGAAQLLLPPRASLPIFGTNKGPIIL